MRSSLALFSFLSLIGCGGGGELAVAGSVGGEKFNAKTAFFGGPFIAFTTAEEECMDFAWVKKSIDEGDEVPVDRNVTSLLLTFDESDVTTGNHSVEGDAPVDARFVGVQGDVLTVHRAREGFLEVTELEDGDHAIGTVSLTFEDGSIAGDFDIDWCANLSSKY
ncbi:MAG: hypothetical protein VX265_10890 [Myxococcota bacterium]|nr:hypothetical protein [Myxococcota bacterium]